MSVKNCLSTNQAAFVTVTSLAAITVASSFGAATTAATAALVAYAILAVSAAGLSVAAITAWVKTNANNQDADAFFVNFKSHAGFALAGTYELVSKTLVSAVIQGLAQGIKNNISRKIGGADHTVEYKRT